MAGPLGLRILPDGGRDQLPLLQERQRTQGRRQPAPEQLCGSWDDGRRRAGRQLPRRVDRRARTDPASGRLLGRGHCRSRRPAHPPQAGGHPGVYGAAEPAPDLRRLVAPLGRRPALWRLHRMGRRQLPCRLLHRPHSRVGAAAKAGHWLRIGHRGGGARRTGLRAGGAPAAAGAHDLVAGEAARAASQTRAGACRRAESACGGAAA